MTNEMVQFLIGSIAILIGGTIGLFISAVVLRGSVGLANAFAGPGPSTARIAEPSIGWAMLVLLTAAIPTCIINLIVFQLTGGWSWASVAFTQCISLITYGMAFKLLLPSTFGKGMLVSFLNWAITLCGFGLIRLLVSFVLN